MRLTKLEYGSLLSYTPRGNSHKIRHARDFMLALKNERFIEDPQTGKLVLMSEWIAKTIKRNIATLPFASFFQPKTTLVPTPKSSLMKPDTLWVPERIASALARRGIGNKVFSCLTRTKSVPKSASSLAKDRPTPADHYKSMGVTRILSKPDEIVLVDDLITRGATFLGAANRLADAFPETHIRAFAAMRTISNPVEFNGLYDPCVGTIKLRESGDSLRRP
jgi:predicted amidophosphoribosyltransferase